MSRRDEYVNKLKEQIDRLNTRLDELEVKAEQASGEAKEAYEARMAQLREMLQPVNDMLHKAKESGEHHWENLEAEAEKTYKAFVHSYNYFKSQMK